MKKIAKKLLVLAILFFTSLQSKSTNIQPPFLQTESEWAEKILASMTLKQKIGQLFIVAAASCFEQPTEMLATHMLACPYRMDEEYITFLITEYGVGGVLFLYKSTPEKQLALTQKYQEMSAIPLLIAQDAEWGLSMRLDLDPAQVVTYPRNDVLGRINDEDLVYRLGKEIGNQCKALGVHMNFAPVVDINNNPNNRVIGTRSFGDDKEMVARLGAAFTKGQQDAGILSCAKHFPGHGDTSVDSHLGLPVIPHSRQRLEEIELYPFKRLIADGVDCVMMAHLAIPALDDRPNRPSSLSYAIVTQELKERLGFKGLVITDGLGMKAITQHFKPGDLELEAFLAGNDIILCPLDAPGATQKIEQAIASGLVSEAELNERVLKVIKAKSWAFKKQKECSIKDPLAYIVKPEAYQLQQEIHKHMESEQATTYRQLSDHF